MIGERIAKRRKELGMTQEELANRMGYKSRSTINKIELGINDINQPKIVKFAEVLRTTPAFLMGWETMTEEEQKNSDAIADITDRLFIDKDFLSLVETISKLDKDQLSRAKEIIGLAFPGIE